MALADPFAPTDPLEARPAPERVNYATGMMLPVASQMDRIGFESIDLAGAVHCDVGVRYLKENPWEKIRLMCEKVKRTPMICTIRSITPRPTTWR